MLSEATNVSTTSVGNKPQRCGDISEKKKFSITLDELDGLGILDRYYFEMRQFQLLSQRDEMELSLRILQHNDIDARNVLVEHNLRLVRWIARRYTWSNMSLEDLIQEGNIGLIIAAGKYNYRLGRFATYAKWWIRQIIRKAIMDRGSLIRLPVGVHELQRKVVKASMEIAEKKGGVPTLEEISSTLGVSKNKILRILPTTIVSLDGPAKTGGDEGDNKSSLGEIIPDENVLSQEGFVIAHEELALAKRRVDAIFKKIKGYPKVSERDKVIFGMFYGSYDSRPRSTVKSIAQSFNLSIQRVSQIINKIWERIDGCGSDINHNPLLKELDRIEHLESLVE